MIARLRQLFARAVALLRPDPLDRDLADDLTAHFELLVDDLIARGLTPDEARRQARLRFGSFECAKEAHRDVRSLRGLETLVGDARYAVRVLRKQPMLTGAVVLTLSLGIGGLTAVVTALNGLLFGAPESRDPAAFVRVIRSTERGVTPSTLPQYLRLRESNTSTRELAAWSRFRLTAAVGRDDPARVPGLLVSCNFFRVFGDDRPVLGRVFDPADCASSRAVAVISDRLWRLRFAEDPAIVGTSTLYGTVPVTIVGVASVPPVQVQADDANEMTDVWFPYSAQPTVKATMAFHATRDLMSEARPSAWLEVGGLLRSGVARSAAEAEFRAIETRHPPEDGRPQVPLQLSDGSRWSADPEMFAAAGAMALTLPALILIMCCINVAALLLPRAIHRQGEMAVRLALGTSRARLLRMLLTESLVIASLATFVSLAIIFTAPQALVRWFGVDASYAAVAFTPDWRVFVCLAATIGVATLVSGLGPALEALNPQLVESLKGRRVLAWARPVRRIRTRKLFVGIQVAASMVPLVVAVLFARTTARYVVPDFDARGLVAVEISEEHQSAASLDVLETRVRALPGVTAAAQTGNLPLIFEDVARVRIGGAPREWRPLLSSVGGDYLEMLGLPLLAGRWFEPRDLGATDVVPVVVSRQFAQHLADDGNALGQLLEPVGQEGERWSVVGVVADRRTGAAMMSRTLDDGSMVYRLAASGKPTGYLLVKAAGDSAVAVAGVRNALKDAMGSAPMVTTFAARLEARVATARQIQALLVGLGGLALLLAVVGVIGTVSSEAQQRRKEFAIRLALGAGPWGIRRRIVASSSWPVAVGLGAGAFAAWGAVTVVETQRLLPLRAVTLDVGPYAWVSALLLLTTVTTVLMVAWPAGRRDPLPALREE